MKQITSIAFLLLFFAGQGCGGGITSEAIESGTSGASTLTLDVTVELPSTTGAPALSLKRAEADDETPQSGLTIEFFNATTDQKIGSCVTDSAGTCPVPGNLEAGEHTLLVQAIDKSGERIACGLATAEVSEDTQTVSLSINTDEDLACSSYLASCEKRLGVPCRPGQNLRDGLEEVVPECVRDAIRSLIQKQEDVSDNSARMMAAMRQAHKEVLAVVASGTPPAIDMACVLKGDSACQTQLACEGEGDRSIKLEGESISLATAASAASGVLDKIVNALCSNPQTFETVKSDPNYEAAFNLFGELAPDEVEEVEAEALQEMFQVLPGDGLSFAKEPLGARAFIETHLSGGFEPHLGLDEQKKRMGALMGAGVPTSRDLAKEYGRSATNLFQAFSFKEADLNSAKTVFGTILGIKENRENFITGGPGAVDNFVDVNERVIEDILTGSNSTEGTNPSLHEEFKSRSTLQKVCNETCTSDSQCVPALICSSGKCLPPGSSSCSGAISTTCQSTSDCLTGLICDSVVKKCALAAVQSDRYFAAPSVTSTAKTSKTAALKLSKALCSPESSRTEETIKLPDEGTQYAKCRSVAPDCNSGLTCQTVGAIKVCLPARPPEPICSGSTAGSCPAGQFCGGPPHNRSCRIIGEMEARAGDVCTLDSHCGSRQSCSLGICTL